MISGLAGVAIWTDRVRDLAVFYRDVDIKDPPSLATLRRR